jgi:hypothetical protein
LLTVNTSARRPSYVRLRVRRRLSVARDRLVELTGRVRGPDRARGPADRRRIFVRRRRGDGAGSRFMDYGPDWPPRRKPPTYPHPLLRRCVAIVVLYAVIWALGSVLLELRLHALRDVTGEPVTTYTTITGSPHHRHH